MPESAGSRRIAIVTIGIAILVLQIVTVFFMELLNSLGSVFGNDQYSPWVELLVFWLTVGLVGQAVALGVRVASRSRLAGRIWIGLWAANLLGVWAALTGPLDDLPTPLVLTAISAPLVWWQMHMHLQTA